MNLHFLPVVALLLTSCALSPRLPPPVPMADVEGSRDVGGSAAGSLAINFAAPEHGAGASGAAVWWRASQPPEPDTDKLREWGLNASAPIAGSGHWSVEGPYEWAVNYVTWGAWLRRTWELERGWRLGYTAGAGLGYVHLGVPFIVPVGERLQIYTEPSLLAAPLRLYGFLRFPVGMAWMLERGLLFVEFTMDPESIDNERKFYQLVIGGSIRGG